MRGEFVDLGGVRLYCYAFGSRGAGDPIVLVHGAFTSSHLWQDVLPTPKDIACLCSISSATVAATRHDGRQ